VTLPPLGIVRFLESALLVKALWVQPRERLIFRAMMRELIANLTRADIVRWFDDTIDYRLNYHFSPYDLGSGLAKCSFCNRMMILPQHWRCAWRSVICIRRPRFTPFSGQVIRLFSPSRLSSIRWFVHFYMSLARNTYVSNQYLSIAEPTQEEVLRE
jgi:hypothetical protein